MMISKHLPRVSSLLRLLFCRLRQVEKRQAFVVVKIWPSLGWWHVSQLPSTFPEKSITLWATQSLHHIQLFRSQLVLHLTFPKSVSATSNFLEVSFCPEDPSIPEPSSTISKSLPLWDSPRPEGPNSEPKAPTIDRPRSSPIFKQLPSHAHNV